MSKVSASNITLFLVISWILCGLVASISGFIGTIYPLISVMLVLPILCLGGMLVCLVSHMVSHFTQLTRSERGLITLLTIVWLMHLTGVGVPETGFDAVWYHLPVVKSFVEARAFIYVPDLYQSLNPVFSDSIFMLGYQLAGALGAKAVAYCLGITLVFVTYQLARLFLTRTWALVAVLLVSTFQVVSWQSSSFYIDIAKAVWELTAIWLVIKTIKTSCSSHKKMLFMLAGFLLGASLASKLFSVALIPVFWTIMLTTPATTKKDRLLNLGLFTSALLVIAIPFYARTYFYSGTLLLSGQLFFDTIPDLNAHSSILNYLVSRIVALPSVVLVLTLARDYVTMMFVVCMPLFIWQLKAFWYAPAARTLLVFTAGQLLLWWFIPPVSSRYALAGFVTLAILYLASVERVTVKYPRFLLPLTITIVLAIIVNLAPRLVVLLRNIDYLRNQPSQAEYVSQFYDGWIDTHLQKWHQLN